MKLLYIMAIPLSQGLFALVDGEDYEELSKFKWYAHKLGNTYYAMRHQTVAPKKRKAILMHRQILKARFGDEVDHRSGYGLDDRKQNIRFCTRSQNHQNEKPRKNKSSRFKGVSWHQGTKKWRTRITYNGKLVHLGSFDDEIKAARLYDIKAKELFGEFAKTNF